MGFYYHHDEDKVFIPAASLPAIYEALRARDEKIVANGYESELEPGYRDWLIGSDPLHMVAGNNEWNVGRDKEGNVVSLSFDEIKGSDNADWLEIIAPFVHKNSFVQIHDDDGRTYRYLFTGEGVKQIFPIWEGESDEQ